MIITLCGSTKYQEELLNAFNELTIKGHIVLANFTDHSKQGEGWKELVDKIHLQKIDMSDAIYVVHSTYIGESTANEIDYAFKHGKNIIYDNQ